MTFKEFAVNYISPFYVLLRLAFMAMAGFGLVTTLSVNAEHLGIGAGLLGLVLALGIVIQLSHRPYPTDFGFYRAWSIRSWMSCEEMKLLAMNEILHVRKTDGMRESASLRCGQSCTGADGLNLESQR